MSQSNGGVAQTSRISAYPMTVVATGVSGLYAFDPSLGFNDPVNLSQYFYKVEEIVPGKTATINSMYVVYRDLGIVAVTFNLTATNDNAQIVTATTGLLTLGNLIATGRIITRNNIGLTLTGQNFQLSWIRQPNAGQLSIIKCVLTGNVEQS